MKGLTEYERLRAQHNRMGFCPKEDWAPTRVYWLSDQIDRERYRELRFALRRLRRVLYVQVGREIQRIRKLCPKSN